MYKKAFELSYKNKKVEIEIQDFVGDVRNINGTEDLFSLSYISDSKDKGQSILVTEADINFYADDYFNIDELKTVGETDIKVKYYEDDALLWSGFVIPDFFSTSVDITPVVSMVATDRVGTLKEISNNSESNIPIQILASCLKQTGQDLPINLIADNNHFETPIQLERIDEIASYDVIRTFMVLFNCKITLYKNAWWIINKKLLESGFVNYKSYNSNGVGGSVTPFAQPILDIDLVDRDGQREIKPTASEISLFLEFGGSKKYPKNWNFRETDFNTLFKYWSVQPTDRQSTNQIIGYTVNGTVQTPIYGDYMTDPSLQYVSNIIPALGDNIDILLYPTKKSSFSSFNLLPNVSYTLDFRINFTSASNINLSAYILAKKGDKYFVFYRDINQNIALGSAGIGTPKIQAKNPLVVESADRETFGVVQTQWNAELNIDKKIMGISDEETDTIEFQIIIMSGRSYTSPVTETTVIIHSAEMVLLDGEVTGKGLIFKIKQGGEKFSKSREPETILFSDKINKGVNGHFYNYKYDDTSIVDLPSEYALSSVRERAGMFSKARDYYSLDGDFIVNPLAKYTCGLKSFVLIGGQNRREDAGIIVEEIVSNTLNRTDFIYTYFDDGKDKVKSIGTASGGSSSSGGGGAVSTPQLWKVDEEGNIYTEYNAYSLKNLSAFGFEEEQGGGVIINVIDNLTSTSKTDPLSANQGRYLKTLIDNIEVGEGGQVLVDWEAITGKPTTFAPSAHTHIIGDVTGLQGALDGKASFSQLDDKEDKFTKNSAFNKNFGTGLNDVARGNHTHSFASLTSIPTTLAGYGITDGASKVHTHSISDVTNLQTALNSKQATLTQGSNITIVNNVIAAVDTTYAGSTSVILSGGTFQRAALTGDVISAQNSNATTIANTVVTGKTLQNYVVGANTVLLAADTILGAFGKLQTQINSHKGNSNTEKHVTQANLDVLGLLSIDIDGNLRINANTYSTGNLSAFGFEEESGGSGGGSMSMMQGWAFTTETENYYLPAKLAVPFYNETRGRLSTLEGGSATTVNTSGTGDLLASVSKVGNNINFIKGNQSWNNLSGKPSVFAPSAHNHDNIINWSNAQTTAQTYDQLPNGVSVAFTSINGGYGSYGSILNVKAYPSSGGGTLQLYIPYSDQYGGTGLKYRKFNYGGDWGSLKTIWDSGNLTNLNQLTTRNFSDLQNKPTTLGGYGITDATSLSIFNTHNTDNIRHITGAERTKWDGVVTDFAGLEIGGRNYAQNSKYREKPLGTGSIELVPADVELDPNDTYTISFDYEYLDNEAPETRMLIRRGSSIGLIVLPTFPKGRATHTFKSVLMGNASAFIIYGGTSSATSINRHVIYQNIKLEKGTKPTDWTPAPEDQVSDWLTTDVNSFSFIKNKPTLLSQFTDNIGVATHIANKTNPHSVTKAQVGLEYADNTSDLLKPISNAMQNALALKLNKLTFDDLFEKVETSTGKWAVKVKYNLFSIGEISAFGASESEGGGGIVNILSQWANYDTSKSGWALSAGLGENLRTRVVALENAEIDLSGYATLNYVNDKVKTNVPLNAKFTDTIVDISGKVDKKTGFSLISDTEITRLSSVTNQDLTPYALKTYVDTEVGKKWTYNETTIKAVKVSNAVRADNVGGFTVGINVPSNAKFTDTIVDISGKVDKVTGKGLSTNDFTTVEKNKLAILENQTRESLGVENVTNESKLTMFANPTFTGTTKVTILELDSSWKFVKVGDNIELQFDGVTKQIMTDNGDIIATAGVTAFY